MKRILVLPLALVATLVVAAATGAATATVQVTQNGFTPTATTITVGDTVTWHNADNANHQVVANDGSFASPVLKSGETFSFTFQKAGKLGYHDSFAPTHKGTVTVNAPAANVMLSADSQRVVYGDSTTLSGNVTNGLANEQVTLTAQPFGKGTQALQTTATSANGAFSFDVSPTIQTTYQAHWKTTDSQSVTVNVAPRVGFGHSGRIFVTRVTSDISYGGHFVWVQRRTPFGGWHNLRRVFLGDNSRAVFRLGLPHGRSVLRVVLPTGQAGAGYVMGISRMLFIRR